MKKEEELWGARGRVQSTGWSAVTISRLREFMVQGAVCKLECCDNPDTLGSKGAGQFKAQFTECMVVDS